MMKEVITDYLLGHLSETEKATFEQEMLADASLKQEVEELRLVWQALHNAEKEPDKSMDLAFYQALEAEKALSEKLPFIPFTSIHSANDTATVAKRASGGGIFNLANFMRFAAAVAGIGLAFWTGRQTAPIQVQYKEVAVEAQVSKPILDNNPSSPLRNASLQEDARAISNSTHVLREIAALKQEIKMTQELVILGLLKNQSASERLKGINTIATLDQPKTSLIQALLTILKQDDNLNVRLSTIETLERFKKDNAVRSSLVAQLDRSEEPLEQTTLIETLLRMRARESMDVLEKLQKDERIDQNVRLLARSSAEELAQLTD